MSRKEKKKGFYIKCNFLYIDRCCIHITNANPYIISIGSCGSNCWTGRSWDKERRVSAYRGMVRSDCRNN